MAASPTPLRPRFYVVRPEPNKTFVPLIAVDELPNFLRLEGIPSNLDAKMINDWSMARVGDTVALQGEYGVSVSCTGLENYQASCGTHEDSSRTSSKEVTDHCGSGEDPATPSKAANSAGDQSYVPVSTLKNQMDAAMSDVAEKSKWEKENDASKTKDAMTPGIFGKKKYCTHWIRTGSCDYVQEGCKYLHVIPDEDTRVQIGIREMPRWAKEDLPLPSTSPEAVKNRGRWSAAASKSWRRQSRAPAPTAVAQQLPIPKTNPTPTSAEPIPVSKQSMFVDANFGVPQRQSPGELPSTAPKIVSNSTEPISIYTPDHLLLVNEQQHRSHDASPISPMNGKLLGNQTPILGNGIDTNQDKPSFATPNHFLSSSTEADTYLSKIALPSTLGYLGSPGSISRSSNFTTNPSAHDMRRRASTTDSIKVPPQHAEHAATIPQVDFAPWPHYMQQCENEYRGPDIRSLSGQDVQMKDRTPAAQLNSVPSADSSAYNQPVGSQTPSTTSASIGHAMQNESQSVGVIGQGRPGNTLQMPIHPPRPMTEYPVHRRFFVNPGEEQYIVARPEPEKPKGSNRSTKRKNGPRGKSRQVFDSGNLISFEPEQSLGE